MTRRSPQRANTYRTTQATLASIADVWIEFANPAGSGIRAEFRIELMQTASYCTLKRNTSAHTGGNSAATVNIPMASDMPPATITGKRYTVAQTGGGAGALELGRIFLAATSPTTEHAPLTDAAPPTLLPGDWLVLVMSATGNTTGFVEWTETSL